MKLMPEAPISLTDEEINEAFSPEDAEHFDYVPKEWFRYVRQVLAAAYRKAYAAAPEVTGEHCGWCHYVQYTNHRTGFKACDSDSPGAFKVYRHPDPRIVELESEVKRLTAAIEKHRLNIWGEDKVANPEDVELYAALAHQG